MVSNNNQKRNNDIINNNIKKYIKNSNYINNKGNPKEHEMNFYCPQLSRIYSAIGNNSISKLCQNNFKTLPFSANKMSFQAPENAKI